MNKPEGQLRALQKFLSCLALCKSILVQDQADANVSLARIDKGPSEALIIKSIERRIKSGLVLPDQTSGSRPRPNPIGDSRTSMAIALKTSHQISTNVWNAHVPPID